MKSPSPQKAPASRQDEPGAQIVREAIALSLQQLRVHDTGVLVGVSGGADSVALLRGLDELTSEFHLKLVVGHFDHALRPESAQDASWVCELAARLGLPFASSRREGSPSTELLPEESARRLRYDFFTEAARQHNCRYVAVAHSANDQAETVLHHILRGTGLQGLTGIPVQRELNSELTLIRPLLRVQRADIVHALADWEQPFLTDSTNVDEQYTRNRLRHSLLPQLRESFNPQVDGALLRLARQAADVQLAMEQLAGELLSQACLDLQTETVRLDRAPFQSAPVAVIREAVRMLWQRSGWGRQQLGFQHLDQLAGMLQTGQPSRISLPQGREATCRGLLLEIRQGR